MCNLLGWPFEYSADDSVFRHGMDENDSKTGKGYTRLHQGYTLSVTNFRRFLHEVEPYKIAVGYTVTLFFKNNYIMREKIRYE